MKKLTVFLFGLFLCITTLAQPVLEVTPGFGTLNDAIAANKGSVIYQLKAGEWYGLNAVIENADFVLTIIGEIPSSPTIMPAMIQVGSDGLGIPLPNMFNIFQDLTLKNVFIVDANENHIQASDALILMQATCKVVIDNCVFDPLNTRNAMVTAKPSAKVFFTNNLVLRSGQMVNPNDGGLFESFPAGVYEVAFDTLYVENNSFISTGTWFVQTNNFSLSNFIWINHNTFVGHKSQLDIEWYENQYFLTNNLFFDFNISMWKSDWNVFYPDGSPTPGSRASRMALVNADTLENEILPSQRKCFVEYNSWYVNPVNYSYIPWGLTHTKNNDGITPLPIVYLMNLGYPPDSAYVNREANMYGSADFPYFKYGNTLEIDPEFTQPKIYDLSDSLAAWNFPAMVLFSFKFDPALVQPVADWAKWFWNADEDGYGNPTAWPRYDGTYTNQAALTGSIEKLPLGDLNWYPQAKAQWQANKAAIETHILACNENQITITGVEPTDSKLPTGYSLSQNYPNPFNPSTLIKFTIPKGGHVSLKVFNLLGQEVASLINKEMPAGNDQVKFDASNLTSGVYYYQLNADGFTMTKRMMLLK